MYVLPVFESEDSPLQVDEVMPMPMQPQDEPCIGIVDELLVLCIFM